MDFLPSSFTDKTITHPDGRVDKKTAHVEKSCNRIAVIATSDQMDGRGGSMGTKLDPCQEEGKFLCVI